MGSINLSVYISEEEFINSVKKTLSQNFSLSFFTDKNRFLKSIKEDNVDAGIIYFKVLLKEIRNFSSDELSIELPIFSYSENIDADFVNSAARIGINRFITVDMDKEKVLSLINETVNIKNVSNFINSLIAEKDKNKKYLGDLIDIVVNSLPYRMDEDEVSSKLQISKRWLQKICMTSFNITYTKLLRKIWIYSALRLFYYTKLDNNEVYLQLNYRDYSNFLRAFKMS